MVEHLLFVPTGFGFQYSHGVSKPLVTAVPGGPDALCWLLRALGAHAQAKFMHIKWDIFKSSFTKRSKLQQKLHL